MQLLYNISSSLLKVSEEEQFFSPNPQWEEAVCYTACNPSIFLVFSGIEASEGWALSSACVRCIRQTAFGASTEGCRHPTPASQRLWSTLWSMKTLNGASWRPRHHRIWTRRRIWQKMLQTLWGWCLLLPPPRLVPHLLLTLMVRGCY